MGREVRIPGGVGLQIIKLTIAESNYCVYLPPLYGG